MSYTRRQFSTDVLKALGNNKPDTFVVSFVVAWTVWETAAGASAAFNLLSTTQPMPGATNYNSIGVRNYVSYAQGIEATIKTLDNGLYSSLVSALRNNEVGRLASGNDRGIEQNLNTWSGGAGYYQKILNVTRGIYNGTDHRDNDMFSGSPTDVQPGSSTASTRTSRPRVEIGPNDSIADILGDVDALLALSNPFDVQNPPKSNVFGAEVIDPFAWLGEVGMNAGENAAAGILRLILILFGLLIAWRGVKSILNVDPFGRWLDG